jgi:hypothetical protein
MLHGTTAVLMQVGRVRRRNLLKQARSTVLCRQPQAMFQLCKCVWKSWQIVLASPQPATHNCQECVKVEGHSDAEVGGGATVDGLCTGWHTRQDSSTAQVIMIIGAC